MIPSLLEHHARRIQRTGKLNALMNCHVRGLVSIMLQDEPENRIRMFFATAQHELWRNHSDKWDRSLAIHAHHCDVTLIRVFGDIYNDVFQLEENAKGEHCECIYRSAITSGEASLHPTGRMFLATDHQRRPLNVYGTPMPAKQLHSIFVPQGVEAAWLVIEGAEDPTYESVCYTPVTHFDSTGMYEPLVHPDSAAVLLRRAASKHLRLQGIDPEFWP